MGVVNASRGRPGARRFVATALAASGALGLLAHPADAQRPGEEKDRGYSVDAWWTQFLGAPVRGDGDGEARLGGKLGAGLVLEGQSLGLWRGLAVNAGAEFVFGRNVNGSGTGAMLPLNSALMFPENGREGVDLALNVTQQLGRSTLTAGKINMLETVAHTPLIGGGGLEGFQLGGLAAHPSIITPPTILGLLWTRPSTDGTLTVGLWDVTSALNRTGLRSPFNEGVAGMASFVLPVTVRGRQGFHGVTVMGTTKRGINLNDIGDLFLPPESEAVVGRIRGGWHAKYTLQQYLWQDDTNPQRAWGLFGHAGLWDANPSPLEWSMTAGVTGSTPVRTRPEDRFGLGYFRVSLSPSLRDGLADVVALDSEQGVELFYTLGMARWLRVTGSAQWVDPAIRGSDEAVLLGVRTHVVFF